MRQVARLRIGRSSRKIREEMRRNAGQQTIAQLLAMLNTKLIRFWYRSVMVPDRARSIEKQLDATIRAVCDESAERASAAMNEHHQTPWRRRST